MEGILAETVKWVKLKCSILSERKHLNLKKDLKIMFYMIWKGQTKRRKRRAMVNMRHGSEEDC